MVTRAVALSRAIQKGDVGRTKAQAIAFEQRPEVKDLRRKQVLLKDTVSKINSGQITSVSQIPKEIKPYIKIDDSYFRELKTSKIQQTRAVQQNEFQGKVWNWIQKKAEGKRVPYEHPAVLKEARRIIKSDRFIRSAVNAGTKARIHARRQGFTNTSEYFKVRKYFDKQFNPKEFKYKLKDIPAEKLKPKKKRYTVDDEGRIVGPKKPDNSALISEIIRKDNEARDLQNRPIHLGSGERAKMMGRLQSIYDDINRLGREARARGLNIAGRITDKAESYVGLGYSNLKKNKIIKDYSSYLKNVFDNTPLQFARKRNPDFNKVYNKLITEPYNVDNVKRGIEVDLSRFKNKKSVAYANYLKRVYNMTPLIYAKNKDKKLDKFLFKGVIEPAGSVVKGVAKSSPLYMGTQSMLNDWKYIPPDLTDKDVQASLYARGIVGTSLIHPLATTTALGGTTLYAGYRYLDEPSYERAGNVFATVLPFVARGYGKGSSPKDIPKEFRAEYQALSKMHKIVKENLGSRNLRDLSGVPKKLSNIIKGEISLYKDKLITGGTSALETTGVRLLKRPDDYDLYTIHNYLRYKAINNMYQKAKLAGLDVKKEGSKLYFGDRKVVEINPLSQAYGNIRNANIGLRSVQSFIKKTPDGTAIIDPLVLIRRKFLGGFEKGSRGKLLQFARDLQKKGDLTWPEALKQANLETYKGQFTRYSKDIPAYLQTISQLSKDPRILNNPNLFNAIQQYRVSRTKGSLPSFRDLLIKERGIPIPNRPITTPNFLQNLKNVDYRLLPFNKRGSSYGLPNIDYINYLNRIRTFGYNYPLYTQGSGVTSYITPEQYPKTNLYNIPAQYLPPVTPTEYPIPSDDPYEPPPYTPDYPYPYTPPPPTYTPGGYKYTVLPIPLTLSEKPPTRKGILPRDKDSVAWQTVFIGKNGEEIPYNYYPNELEATGEGFIGADNSKIDRFRVHKTIVARELIKRGREARKNYKFKKKGGVYIEKIPYRKDTVGEGAKSGGVNTLQYAFGVK